MNVKEMIDLYQLKIRNVPDPYGRFDGYDVKIDCHYDDCNEYYLNWFREYNYGDTIHLSDINKTITDAKKYGWKFQNNQWSCNEVVKKERERRAMFAEMRSREIDEGDYW